MATITRFRGFPDAYPHFPESQLAAKRAEARALLSAADFGGARDLNEKIGHSRDYYDLSAIAARGLTPSSKSLQRLRKGFMSRNTDRYRDKGDGARRGYFDDPDSRWFGMTRAEAREIVLDEIYANREAGEAETPMPSEDASAASTESASGWAGIVVPVVLAIAVGYGVHALTSRDD
jgi:hypothetical protein